ncbi:MAG: MarR family winged helix-turn-helix transcriptional regulator, partial [Nitrososphaera sp.]
MYDLSVAGTQLEVARAYLASQLGISSPQYNIMMVVAQYQLVEGVSISEVARHLHVTTAHVGAEVKTLEANGGIQRIVNPNDRRSTLLKLTPSSELRINELGDELRFVNDHLFR